MNVSDRVINAFKGDDVRREAFLDVVQGYLAERNKSNDTFAIKPSPDAKLELDEIIVHRIDSISAIYVGIRDDFSLKGLG